MASPVTRAPVRFLIPFRARVLRSDSTLFPATDLIQGRAIAVEKAVFAQFGVTSQEYKSKIRSLFVNLKDKANPSLRESVVSGELLPEKFSKMTSEVPHFHLVVFLSQADVSHVGNDVRGTACF